MARNILPNQTDRLFTLAEDMIDGLGSIGSATGVVQNTVIVMQTALDGGRDAEIAFQKARQGKVTATAAQTIADSNAKAFIATAKRVLIPHLGSAWSTAWAEVGFVNQSLQTPAAIEERYTLLNTMRGYLAAHPAHENAPLGITAAAAGILYDAFTLARGNLNKAMNALGAARDTRETALETLRIRMRGLIDELDVLLIDDDPRWYTFGLNAPGDPETPGIPEAPTLTPGAPGSGRLFIDWPDTRRSDRFRVWLKKTGETEASPVATVTESEASLTNLPLNTLLELHITAANDAGESVRGPVAVVTLE